MCGLIAKRRPRCSAARHCCVLRGCCLGFLSAFAADAVLTPDLFPAPLLLTVVLPALNAVAPALGALPPEFARFAPTVVVAVPVVPRLLPLVAFMSSNTLSGECVCRLTRPSSLAVESPELSL